MNYPAHSPGGGQARAAQRPSDGLRWLSKGLAALLGHLGTLLALWPAVWHAGGYQTTAPDGAENDN